jgi:hypothetical protein
LGEKLQDRKQNISVINIFIEPDKLDPDLNNYRIQVRSIGQPQPAIEEAATAQRDGGSASLSPVPAKDERKTVSYYNSGVIAEQNTIRLKNIVTGTDFELRRINPRLNSFSVWVDNTKLDSLFEFDEDEDIIAVHNMSLPSEYVSQGIGLTILEYLAGRAKIKGKDLVLYNVISYAVARMCYEHISKKALYRINKNDERRFEEIDWLNEFGPMEIQVADKYRLLYKKTAGAEPFAYLPSQNNDLKTRDMEDKLGKTISVRIENGKVLAAWNSAAGKAPLNYQVFNSKWIWNIYIRNEDIMSTAVKADGGAMQLDGGFEENFEKNYRNAVQESLLKFMKGRDPQAGYGKAKVFHFEFTPEFSALSIEDKKEAFRDSVEHDLIDRLPVKIDEKIIKEGNGADFIVRELCNNSFDGIMSLAFPKGIKSLTPSPLEQPEYIGHSLSVYFEIVSKDNNAQYLAISVEDDGAGKKGASNEVKKEFIGKGIIKASPFFGWTGDWRKYSPGLIDTINNNVKGGGASYKEDLADESGQKSVVVFDLPLECLVLTGFKDEGRVKLEATANLDGGQESEMQSTVVLRKLLGNFFSANIVSKKNAGIPETLSPNMLKEFKSHLKAEFYLGNPKNSHEIFEIEKIKTMLRNGSNNRRENGETNDPGIRYQIAGFVINLLTSPSQDSQKILYIIYNLKCSEENPITFKEILVSPFAKDIGPNSYKYVYLLALSRLGLITIASRPNAFSPIKITGVNQEFFKALYPDIESWGAPKPAKPKSIAAVVRELVVKKARDPKDGIKQPYRENIEKVFDKIDRYSVALELGLEVSRFTYDGVRAAKRKIKREIERLSEQELKELIKGSLPEKDRTKLNSGNVDEESAKVGEARLVEEVKSPASEVISKKELESVRNSIEKINKLSENRTKTKNYGAIINELLKIARKGKPVFSGGQARAIWYRVELGPRLKETLEYLLYLQADNDGRKTFLLSGSQIALIIRSKRSLQEISLSVNELKKKGAEAGPQRDRVTYSLRDIEEILKERQTEYFKAGAQGKDENGEAELDGGIVRDENGRVADNKAVPSLFEGRRFAGLAKDITSFKAYGIKDGLILVFRDTRNGAFSAVYAVPGLDIYGTIKKTYEDLEKLGPQDQKTPEPDKDLQEKENNPIEVAIIGNLFGLGEAGWRLLKEEIRPQLDTMLTAKKIDVPHEDLREFSPENELNIIFDTKEGKNIILKDIIQKDYNSATADISNYMLRKLGGEDKQADLQEIGWPQHNNADGGTQSFVRSIQMRSGSAAVLGGNDKDNLRPKTIAVIYPGSLDPARENKNKEHRIILVHHSEVTGYTPEQCLEIARKLPEALDDAKRNLGIADRGTLEQILAKNFLVVENTLVVMSPEGVILTGAIDSGFRAKIKDLVLRERGGKKVLNRVSVGKGLDELKKKILAEYEAQKYEPSGKDGGYDEFCDAIKNGEYERLAKLGPEVLSKHLRTMYPELIAQEGLLETLVGFLKSKEAPSDSVREIAAAKSLLAEFAKSNKVLFVLQGDNPFSPELFKITLDSVLTAVVSEEDFLKTDSAFYKRQKEKIRGARFTTIKKTMDYYFWLNKDFVKAINDSGGTTAILLQNILHEFGHNIVEDIYPASIWMVYSERRGGGRLVKYLKRAGEFLADKFAIDVSPKLGFSVDAYLDFYGKIEAYRDFDDREYQHQFPRYVQHLLREKGRLDDFRTEDFRKIFLKNFSDDITSWNQWKPIEEFNDFLREYGRSNKDERKKNKKQFMEKRKLYFKAAEEIQSLKIRENILWDILVELELFKQSEREDVFNGFEDWLNTMKGISPSGSPQQDGGSATPGGVDFRQLPVSGQPSADPVLMPQLQKLAANSKMKDLDQEWNNIRGEMLSPDMPYKRIKEYIAVCLSRPDCRKKLDQAVTCIINILRMEEDQALATNQEFKDILMYLS